MQSPLHPLIAVLGPTGAGKSDLALHLARNLSGEIVNFDSIQVYKRLNVGAAKLPVAERCGIPHHLLDILEIDEELTAGAFARQARDVLQAISARNRLPILAGGTGFYLRALLDGLSPAPRRDESLRGALAGHAPAVLHRYLRRRDPQAAARIHPNDRQKLIRAVEMTVLAGRPASQTQSAARQSLEGYSVVKIGLVPDRVLLCKRLNERTGRMFQTGLLDETGALLAEGISPRVKALQSLGYKQAVAHLRGELDIEAAVEDCQIKTRQYAKRQMTWFRAEKDVFWLNGFGEDTAIQRQALDHVREALNLAA